MRSTNGGGKTILIRKPYKTNKNISRLFYILMMIIFVWFIGIQILGPDEQFFDQSGHSIIYNGTFTWKKSDGTKQNISVPGRYKVPAKQTMIITTTLPDDYNENVIAIRSSLQDVRFYIDGKLRKEYNAKSLHRFGKNSASRYIFCNTSSADAGKELCLELTTYTSNYSGVVNTIYCGDQMQIWSYIFNHNFSDHLSFLHRLSQSYSVSPLELFTKPSLIWNILDGVCLWVLSG